MPSVERTTTIEHEKGLHARPASAFVQTASEFDSEITVSRRDGGADADAKSSISVMSLGVEAGEAIVISADGPDAERAVDRLVELVDRDFETASTAED